MILLPAIGAAAFALATFGLPAFALPAKGAVTITQRETRQQLQSVNLAEVVSTAQAQGDGADGLPRIWCGDERTSDDTANAATPAAKAQFKIVYAYAADRPNRFAGWKDALEVDVAIAQRFLSAQDGGSKALRIDMGTRCGPQYVDIQVVPLPGARAAYADNFDAIRSAVQSALGAATGPRNALVLADGLAGSAQEYGLGEVVMGASGETSGAANVHNRGGLTAILFSRDGAPAPGAARWGWWPEGMLHEMTHNLGSVQWGAPHSTQPAGQSRPQYGHCWQGADVMCYTEDAGAAHPMQADCAVLPGAIPQSYDCGRDDYFNPAPAPDSYLATHWNTYDSAFLAACGEIAPACGGGQLWVPTPPAATSSPTIAGGARRGSTLTAGPGAWSNAPSVYAYRWERLTAAGWAGIDGATGVAYRVTGQDLGRRLRVSVVATNADGASVAASAPSAPIGGAGINRATSSSKAKRAKSSVKAKAAARKARAARKAKVARKAKAARKASAARKAKAARKASAARKAKAARKASAARKAKAARKASFARKAKAARDARRRPEGRRGPEVHRAARAKRPGARR